MTKRAISTYLTLILLLLVLVIAYYGASFLTPRPAPQPFDGSHAYRDVQTQIGFGPRIPGSEGHDRIRAWIRTELEAAGWIVEVHESNRLGHPIFNIIAKRNNEAPQIILGAHYDTRMLADQDPDPGKQNQAVPGANDGASGVAVLLELGRSLPAATVPVWLVFFDAEDNGHIEGWDWILGSRAFVEEVKVNPRAVVIVDMIGDADLGLYYEGNSDVALRSEIWESARLLGYDEQFIAEERYSMLDDHTPFLEAGIPAIDIIDFDYEYWHTTEDTADKVSAQSLAAVGDTLWHWLVKQKK